MARVPGSRSLAGRREGRAGSPPLSRSRAGNIHLHIPSSGSGVSRYSALVPSRAWAREEEAEAKRGTCEDASLRFGLPFLRSCQGREWFLLAAFLSLHTISINDS